MSMMRHLVEGQLAAALELVERRLDHDRVLGEHADGLPHRLRDWDRIEVTEDEAAAMATNGLPINPETYVTDPEFGRVGKELEARGIAVEYVDFAVSRLFGGAFRCSTQPLLRAD
ncbi:hypothetical protein GPX89_11110 [Nocardia sp. ET3-3]|uniref:Amidinotransferase n=1 Tax=Nocardia terrae TaxID=2675851 RepID=A0A7K1UTX1_9NOCA|nr:hypothetical protein [Nocardia terrae]MVU77790.1 hypothetical protein [Nocardia terrae]